MNCQTSVPRFRAAKSAQNDINALRAENERLREFAFRASHDLKSPLRAVISLAEWIAQDLESTFGKLPANITSDLDEIGAQSARMSKLISDLLDLSQISNRAGVNLVCDPNHEIAECLHLCMLPAGFEVRVDPGFPAVSCSPVEFSLIIRNLICNAIEHHDKQVGLIEVGHWKDDKYCYLRVRDDGPGIVAKHREEIFELFKKLAPSTGSGIGLGMVRQIAEQCGGSASVRPNPAGRGSDFEVSLPIMDIKESSNA